MSLWDAERVPSRVIGLMHTAVLLEATGKLLSREVLEMWMSPDGYSAATKNVIFNQTFLECKQLGLVRVSEDQNVLTVDDKFLAAVTKLRHSEIAGLPGLSIVTELVRQHVYVYLAQDPTPDPGFCRLLAWFLLQNGRDLPITTQRAEQLSSEQDPDRKYVNLNSVRYGSSRFWAVFLGFAWQLSTGSSEALQPDPTIAFEFGIDRWILEGIDTNSLIPVSDFVTKMAHYYPWIENGKVAKSLRSELYNGAVQSERRLNDTTSLALSRLEKKGIVGLLYVSDAANVHTLGWGGARREISHIELTKNRIAL